MKDGVTKLGPNVRFGIWTQGCPRRCPGCMTPESQPLDQGEVMETEELADKIRRSGHFEITISGGEPFIQAESLSEMIKELRKSVDLGVIIYTGYTIEEIEAFPDPSYRQLLGQCDLLIDGAYVEALNDGKNLRGSSNQRAIALTDRYREFAGQVGNGPAEVEFFFQEEKISMVGVPSAEVLERFKNAIF